MQIIFHTIHFSYDSFISMGFICFHVTPPPTHTYTIKFFHVHFTSLPLLLYATFSHDSFARFVNFSWDFFFLKHMIQLFFTNHWLMSMIHLFLHDSFVTWFFIFTQDILNFTCNFCLPHYSFITTWFIYVHMIPPHTHHSFFHVIFLHSSFNLTRFLTIHLNSHVLDSFIFHERFFSYARFNRFPLIMNW